MNVAPSRRFARWLLLLAGGVSLAVLLIARTRRDMPVSAPLPAPDETGALPSSPFSRDVNRAAESVKHLFRRREIRWLVFGLAAVGILWLLLWIKPPYSTLGLTALIVIGGIIGIRRTSTQVIHQNRLSAHPLVRLIVRFRVAIAYVMAVCAVTLLLASAYAFDPSASVPLLREAVTLLVIGGLLLGAALQLSSGTPHVPPLSAPLASGGQTRLTFRPRVLVIGALLLALLALIRVVSAPLPLEDSTHDPLLTAVIMSLKNRVYVSGEVQFLLLIAGLLTLTFGLGRPGILRRMSVTFGLLTLIVLSEINGKVFKLLWLYPVSTNVQFWLLVIGIALVVIGLGGWPRWTWPDRNTALLLGGIAALALFLRFWHLHDSIRFLVDELSFAGAVQITWVEPHLEILAPMESVAAFPYLFAYLQSQGVALFGRTFIGLRAASAVLGTLAIPAVYLLGRALFDRKTALAAALLLATFPPHLHFSRLGLSEIAGPLFGVLALAFLGRGMVNAQRLDFALGGAMLGLTHYFHEGSRVLYTPLTLLWLIAIALVWRPRVRIDHLLTAAATTLIVAVPIYYTLIGMDRPLAARLVNNNSALDLVYWRELFESSDFELHILKHVIPPFLIYVHLVDNTLFYRGRTGLVLTAVAPAFFLGLFYALWRWRAPGLLLLALWWAATTLGNTMMVDSAGSPRYVMVFPALALLAAVGLRCGLKLLWPVESRMWVFVLAVLTIGLAGVQAHYYFNQHLPLYNRQFRDNWPHPDAQDAILRFLARDFPPETQIHIVSEVAADLFFTRGVLGFMSQDYDLNTLTNAELNETYVSELKRDVGHAFFIERRSSDENRILGLLRQHFDLKPMPEATQAALGPYDPIPEKRFMLFYASP